MVKPEEIKNFNDTIVKISDYDFSDYSEKSFGRRLEKILADYKLSIDSLIKKIKQDKPFLEQIVKDITVNTTELFRDPQIWHILRYQILKQLEEKEKINIWHAGCSTGQEVYSMLILLQELGMEDKANIFATDINTDVINISKKGQYVYRFNIEYLENFKQVIQVNPYNYDEIKDVPFSKYFKVNKIKDTITVKPFLQNRVIYRKQDLVKGVNIFYNKFDLILCRNVLIYFNTRLQNRIFRLFAESLVRKGFLVLGAHESILGAEASRYIKHGKYYIKK